MTTLLDLASAIYHGADMSDAEKAAKLYELATERDAAIAAVHRALDGTGIAPAECGDSQCVGRVVKRVRALVGYCEHLGSDANRAIEQTRDAERRLQTERDYGRYTGQYAFHHRHLALSYVRTHDAALHQAATRHASDQMQREHRYTYPDFVATLEQERDVAKNRIEQIKQAAIDAAQSVYEELRAGATHGNIPLAIAARMALRWGDIERDTPQPASTWGIDNALDTARCELKAARADNEFLREWLRGELTLADADIDAALRTARAQREREATQ